MTTLIHQEAHPTVYAHRIEYGQFGRVTPSSWRQAFNALAEQMDRELRSGNAEAIAIARELTQWESQNGKALQKEALVQKARDAKPVKVYAQPTLSKGVRAPLPDVHCNNCGAEFTPSRKTQRFCSERCRTASHYKEKSKPRKSPTTKKIAAPTLPKCPCCSASFSPTQKNITYCPACRANGNAKRYACRKYQKAYPDKKNERDRQYRAKHRKSGGQRPCQRCGENITVTVSHQRYCQGCRVVVDRELRRAYDQKKAMVFKAYRAAEQRQEALPL